MENINKKTERDRVGDDVCFRNCGEMSGKDGASEMASPCAVGSQVSAAHRVV